jgi:tellurite resistance protein TehA-like permease
MFLPLMVLNFLEATFILAIFAVIFGSIYWAFQDTEFMQGFPQYIAGILGFIWGLIMAAWEAIFG